MQTLAFDGRMGASGDMILGSLIAVGADPATLEPVERALDVRYRITDVVENGIAATGVDVIRADGDESEPDDDRTSAEGTGPHRSYDAVISIVEDLPIDDDVERTAVDVFRLLGDAEAAVHGESLSSIHFHEVGADDAIADIVGACLLVDDLGVERVVTTPVAVGGGTVAMRHGRYPVPGPAVVRLAEGATWSIRGGPVDTELLTPTGAAILARFAEGVDWLPPLAVESSGYGAGDRSVEGHPNVLRAIVGADGGDLRRESIEVLETNLDDVSPEVLGGLQGTLGAVGALDVSIVPLTMKKSRPGHLVKVVVRPEDAERVATALARETGTLGVRSTGASHRWVAEREIRSATVRFGDAAFDVRVKVASDRRGRVYDASAEFDDAATVAAEADRPVREVMRRAEAIVMADEVGTSGNG